MELMQDGVVAALAAIGVTALLWLAASVLLYRESPVDAVYVMKVSGDAAGLDAALRAGAQGRRVPVRRVDGGRDGAGRRAVSLLAGDNVKLVTPEELASLYTEEKKVR